MLRSLAPSASQTCMRIIPLYLTDILAFADDLYISILLLDSRVDCTSSHTVQYGSAHIFGTMVVMICHERPHACL